MRLYDQCWSHWTEVKTRGVCEDKVFISFQNEWAIYELDRKELETNGFAETEWDHYKIFTEEGKAKEDKANAEAIANPVAKKFYVWAPAWGKPNKRGHSYRDFSKWVKYRIIGWTQTKVFVDYTNESGDYPEVGKVAWLDRKNLREKGESSGTHSTFYTEAGMKAVKEKQRQENLKKATEAREQAERMFREHMRNHQYSSNASASRDDARILGISVNARADEITTAFKRLVKVHHPDCGGSADAFRRIVEAKNRMMEGLKQKAAA